MKRAEDREAFERAMREVEPLGKRPARVARPRRRSEPVAVAPVDLESTAFGEHQAGRAADADGEELRRLETGDYPPELTIDLHGMTADAARAEVAGGLRRARAAGMRVVRIVHGRGLRSPDGPVLKTAVPQWLAMPPHGRWVLAFTSAGRYGARGGATLVLLRRS